MKNWKGVLAILLMSVLSLGFSLSAFAAETDELRMQGTLLPSGRAWSIWQNIWILI